MRKRRMIRRPPKKMGGRMKRKLVGLFGLVVLALVGLGIRITYINATEGEQYKKQVLTQSQRSYDSRTIPFKRGDILDRNGTTLATSDKVYNVILDCKVVNSEEKYVKPTTDALTSVLGMEESKVTELLTNEKTKDSQYQVVIKGISISDKKKFEEYSDYTKKDLSDEEVLAKKRIKGVWFEEDYKRNYPFNSLASHVIGFTYGTNEADWGLEGYYSSTLNGVDGRQYGYFNEDADVEQTIIEPKNGNSIVSTIDLYIQQTIEKEIEDFQKNMANGPNGPEAAKNIGVIIANPQNGEILGMASSGSFDLNNPRDLTGIYSNSEIESMTEEEKTESLYDVWKNYCITETYEPGSTVKPATVAAGLETDSVSKDSTFYCDGYQMVSGVKIKCSNIEGHGEETLEGGLRDSCNDVMMQIAEKMGSELFLKYQKIFNFGSKTGIDLPGEASGVLHSKSSMNTVELATASIGQGYNCTMIQEIAAICSIANGGYYYQPHTVKQILDSNGSVIKNIEPTLLRQTVSSEVANSVREYMQASVNTGTGKFAKVQGYSAGGKTGTAQKIPRGNGKYLVSFIGITPIENPELVIYVVVDEPNVKEQADSRFPQYIARNIMKQVLPYMNIFPDEDENLYSYDEYAISQLPSFMIPAYTTNGSTTQGEEGQNSNDNLPEGVSDTNVPEPEESKEDEDIYGNDGESDGITNEESELNN